MHAYGIDIGIGISNQRSSNRLKRLRNNWNFFNALFTYPLISLFLFQLSCASLALILVVALFIGMAKTGVHGAGMMSVPIFANVFDGQLYRTLWK